MRLIQATAGWILISLGAILLALGHIVSYLGGGSQNPRLSSLSPQLKEAGFILVLVGLLSWLVISLLRDLRVVK